VLRVDLRSVVLQCPYGLQHRLQDLVVHPHQLGRQSGGGLVLGRHGGEHVADTAHLFFLGDEDWPIVVEKTHPAIGRDIPGRGYDHHPRGGPRRGGVDTQDPGSGVWRQNHGTVQHLSPLEVVHIGPVTERHLLAAMAGQGASDSPRPIDRGLTFTTPRCRQELDGVEDLDVAGTATQVPVDGAGDLGAVGRRVTVQEVLGLERESGYAVAALQSRRRHEAASDEPALLLGQAFQGQDLLVLNAAGGHGAGDLRQAIDERQTAAALTLWLAAVLGGEDPAAGAQGLQESLIRTNRQRLPATVERKLDELSRCHTASQDT